MVRRRSASPRASAPVRSAAPARAPAPAAAPPRPAGAPPAGATPQGPGLFGQMAATAGGVAIGSAVGHAIGNMFSGGAAHEAAPAAENNAQGYEKQQPQQYSQPCEFEWRQFLDCSQNQSDVSVCQGYNDLFKECKARQGL